MPRHGLLLAQLLIAVFLSAAGTGCVGSAAARFDRTATALGLERGDIEGRAWSHAFYFEPLQPPSRRLHVYLESDGLPWRSRHVVSHDPTPRSPVALRLLRLDREKSVLLGRPCYHQVPSQECSPLAWTHGRYSLAVVDSLEAATRKLQERFGADETALIGFSGGGVLAMLLAERLENTRAVVTVAANLDTDAWTRLHGFTPLHGSLNPAARPTLPPTIRQIHLAGGRDRNVPPDLVRSAIRRQVSAEMRVYESFEHACCWEEIWQEILAWLDSD